MGTPTNGNIIVEDIKIGDIQYEFNYDFGVKSKVITLPTRDRDGLWKWKNENLKDGSIIDYAVREELQQYAPKL